MLKIVQITKNRVEQHEIVLNINGKLQSFLVECSEAFVPHISNIPDKLRTVLINNPQANQEIIQAIQDFNEGMFVPRLLTEWQPTNQSQIA